MQISQKRLQFKLELSNELHTALNQLQSLENEEAKRVVYEKCEDGTEIELVKQEKVIPFDAQKLINMASIQEVHRRNAEYRERRIRASEAV